PAAGLGHRAVGHGLSAAGAAPGCAEDEAEIAPGEHREGGRGMHLLAEPEMPAVEGDGRNHVVHDVADADGRHGRACSVARPSPLSSSTAALRPVMAMTSASMGPDTSGPVPWAQLASVACRVRPSMRRLVPMRRFEFL